MSFNFTRQSLLHVCLALLLISYARAQEKPTLRDFGSSLKKDPAHNNQSQKPNDDDEVVRVQTDLVVCDVLVVDKQGKTIPGLTRDDFVVREDDRAQQIATFSLGDNTNVPRSIVLILDYSFSELPYIKTSVEAAKVLVDQLGAKDRMALVTDDVQLLVDFTRDKELLKKNLDLLKNKALAKRVGQSLQYSALMATLNEMFNNEDIRPIVIFQTDGDQLSRLKDGLSARDSFSFRDVTNAVEHSRAMIYSVVPGASLLDLSPNQRVERIQAALGDDLRNDAQLQSLAERRFREQLAIAGLAKLSGGWPDFLEKAQDAGAVYARIFADINNRYVIGYYPGNKTRDGNRRKISIEVRNHPECVVWGRKTYIAPKE
ncbi:MAG TPA: hypothetical protein DC054_17645 [Blastocatellia bacterium]|nr:hypothetical protein [Blastocatellia bacterium]